MAEMVTKQKELKTDFLSQPLWTTLNLDWEKTIYFAFIVIALITRLWDLGSRVMSHDESLHTQFSYQFYNGEGYSHTPLMHGPFLFHITAVSYWLFGDSDMSARLPVALFGILLVVMPYFLRHWIGRVGALFTSFFFLISPYVTYYSRYIRHDVYVIVWALITFFAMWYYLRQPKDKYLWWFAAGTALMFSTKEVSFIYVAIFGSFLVLQLLSQIMPTKWFQETVPRLRLPILVLLAGVLLVGAGQGIKLWQARDAEVTASSQATDEGFAADPEQDLATAVEGTVGDNAFLGWLQVAGILILSAGLFFMARALRPHLDAYPGFDLIILFTTLILPTVSPLLTTLVGQNPMEYSITPCALAGQENMSILQVWLARLGQRACWEPILNSSVIYSISFLILTVLIGVLVGLWWHNRRWLIAAAIFHSIFAILYTSVFTNPGGWASGAVGSLGYWLEQQEVARGNQPEFYYLFAVSFYEFLPLIFSLLAVRYWTRKYQINDFVGYWLTLPLLALLGWSLTNWRYNLALTQINQPPSNLPGLLVALFILGAGILYWFLVRRRQILNKLDDDDGLTWVLDREALFSFIPSVIWWLLLTWVAYSVAGEKMPWLSIHFVIPMAILSGWYFNEKLAAVDWAWLFSSRGLALIGLTMVLIVAVVLAIGPLLLGIIQFGNQQVGNLNGIGRFLGSLLAAIGIFYLWQRQAGLDMKLDGRTGLLIGSVGLAVLSLVILQGDTLLSQIVRVILRLVALAGGVLYVWERRDEADSERDGRVNIAFVLAVFGLLAFLTIRFTYMANFPNADYTTEYMVYAHGAPATKSIVMEQVEELSMRLHGDKSLRVAFDSDASWPFTWYLREYPNRVFFGKNPSNTLNESPALIVGSDSWDEVEPYLGDNYEQRTYTFLWWPMEEYRRISWNAIFGDATAGERRGLGNPKVRQALWDIFFYRDYTKYGQVFGGNYTPGEWPLRHDLRLYIRKDVLANLWDYGMGAAVIEPVQNPYAEGELTPEHLLTLGEVPGTAEGQFSLPRNVAVGSDGRVYVADSGNHRIQVFEEDGQFVTMWGEFGSAPGQFNEPWGLAVDETHVYVADTWNHRIQKFTLDGSFVDAFGISGSAPDNENGLGLFFGPRDLVLLPDNRLLVTDTGNHRMQVVDRDGQFLAQVGSFGNQLGQLNEPVGLGVSPDGIVYLADTWNGRIQQFSPELFALNEWRVEAWVGNSIDNKPYIDVDSMGRIYVSDPEGFRILIFNSEGEYLGRFGSFGTEVTSLALPNGLALDAHDNLYVVDANNHRVLKFAPLFGPPLLESGLEGEDSSASDESAVDEDSAEDVPADEAETAEEETPLDDEAEAGDNEDDDEEVVPTDSEAGDAEASPEDE